MIVGDSAKATLEHLVSHGLDRDCLSHCLGGRVVEKAAFADWVRQRLSVEECLGDAFLSRSDNLKPPPNNNNNMMMMVQPQDLLRGAARKEAQQQQYNQTARRVYERSKLNLMVAQGKVTVLQKRKATLQSRE